MVDFLKFLPIFVLLLYQVSGFAQESKKISDKTNELKHLKKEIIRLEDELKVKSRKEKKSVEMIENINKQNLMLNQVINSIRQEEKLKDDEIDKTELQISEIEKRIKKLKFSYAKYVVYLYKYGRNDKLKWLLGSESINQALIRNKYLQKITDRRERDISELKTREMELSGLQISLARERDEKHTIALKKQNEEKLLQDKLSDRKSILATLRNDKESLRKELDLKKKAEGDIKGWIAKLIEEERVKEELRRKEEARKTAEAKKLAEARKLADARKIADSKKKSDSPKNPDEENQSKKQITANNKFSDNIAEKRSLGSQTAEKNSKEIFESFIAKGSLHWPVDNGRIVHRFGENRNSKLNTVTINYGIDIKTSAESPVKAALDGTVSTVNWVPGYGSVLIITHRNGLRTVYGHLGEIYVREGAKISSGSVIGKIGESLEGNILHFEVWNERANQNPETWLSRK